MITYMHSCQVIKSVHFEVRVRTNIMRPYITSKFSHTPFELLKWFLHARLCFLLPFLSTLPVVSVSPQQPWLSSAESPWSPGAGAGWTAHGSPHTAPVSDNTPGQNLTFYPKHIIYTYVSKEQAIEHFGLITLHFMIWNWGKQCFITLF